jgi:radical SAM protein with 4Fe4S-binding SPASM domain
MRSFQVLHTGNRAVGWCDMESSRFFVRDDGLKGGTYSQHARKYLDFPTDRLAGREVRLLQSFVIRRRDGADLAIFPNRPGWIAGTEGMSEVLDLLQHGKTFTPRDFYANSGGDQLKSLLVSLYIKGLASLSGEVCRYDDKWEPLWRSDEIALVELTRGCNLRCRHCFNSSEKVLPGELTFDEICQLVQKIIHSQDERISDKTLVLSGGEPFLRRDIFDIIDYVNGSGYCAEILTNGTRVGPDIVEELRHRDVKIRVSLDGCTPHTHEWMRGRGTFIRTVQAISELRDAGINVGITTAISSHNCHEIDKMLKFVDSLNVEFFQFIIVNRLGRAISSNVTAHSDSDVYQTFYRIIKERPGFRDAMRDSTLGNVIACNTSGLFFHHCGLGIQKNFYVQADGDIFPCRATILPEFRLGNVRSMQLDSFVELEHPLLNKFQQLTIDSLNPTCTSCTFRYWCSGECRGETYQATGDLTVPTLHCDELINGFETVLWLMVRDPDLYFEKSNAFFRRTGRSDFITQALEEC